MSKPSQKAPEIEAALTGTFGFDRREHIKANRCVPPPIGCGGEAHEFRDALSEREYAVSGLCQQCQDKSFGQDDEGSKMWTLESAIPFLREIESAVNPFGYYVALAGSVLYQGYSQNDLDIHLYEHLGGAAPAQEDALNWFKQQGWVLKLACEGEGLCDNYGNPTCENYVAQRGAQKINVFFTRFNSIQE